MQSAPMRMIIPVLLCLSEGMSIYQNTPYDHAVVSDQPEDWNEHLARDDHLPSMQMEDDTLEQTNNAAWKGVEQIGRHGTSKEHGERVKEYVDQLLATPMLARPVEKAESIADRKLDLVLTKLDSLLESFHPCVPVIRQSQASHHSGPSKHRSVNQHPTNGPSSMVENRLYQKQHASPTHQQQHSERVSVELEHDDEAASSMLGAVAKSLPEQSERIFTTVLREECQPQDFNCLLRALRKLKKRFDKDKLVEPALVGVAVYLGIPFPAAKSRLLLERVCPSPAWPELMLLASILRFSLFKDHLDCFKLTRMKYPMSLGFSDLLGYLHEHLPGKQRARSIIEGILAGSSDDWGFDDEASRESLVSNMLGAALNRATIDDARKFIESFAGKARRADQ